MLLYMCTILHMLHAILGLILVTPSAHVNARRASPVVRRPINSEIGAVTQPGVRLPGLERWSKMSEPVHYCIYSMHH